MTRQLKDGVELRRGDNSERFVAFAFAAADLVAEVDFSGKITYAAGAYRSKMGAPPDAWIGRSLRDLVTPADHDALDTALMILTERGRLLPWTVRLSNKPRTEVALAGLRLESASRPARLCVTFALPPAPLGGVLQASSASGLARATEARQRSGISCELGLLEVEGSSGDVVGPALEVLAPNALTSEIALGRFGLLGPEGTASGLVDVAAALEALLRDQGVTASVSSHALPLAPDGLTRPQAARALRQALDAFAKGGVDGMEAAGFGKGLAGYVQGTMKHAGAMRRAIKEQRFALLFQPIVSLQDREPHHMEALLRPEPVPGCPADSPQDFVLLAETIGLATELDLAVAAMACEAATRADLPIAFNLSGQSMQDPVFRDRLVATLIRSPARKANRLVVEMTETAQLENVEEAVRTAQLLREMGIPFCLDDFGAGGADVRVLRAMPADIVKLDGSYIPGIISDGRERAFMTGMIEIARAAGAAVVAERVETEAEAEVLKSLSVDYGQGWLFGRPAELPVHDPIVIPGKRKGDSSGLWG